jgi:hypothetical protein
MSLTRRKAPNEPQPTGGALSPTRRTAPSSSLAHAGARPAAGWGPYREGSRQPEGGRPGIHSPGLPRLSPPAPSAQAPGSGPPGLAPRDQVHQLGGDDHDPGHRAGAEGGADPVGGHGQVA